MRHGIIKNFKSARSKNSFFKIIQSPSNGWPKGSTTVNTTNGARTGTRLVVLTVVLERSDPQPPPKASSVGSSSYSSSKPSANILRANLLGLRVARKSPTSELPRPLPLGLLIGTLGGSNRFLCSGIKSSKCSIPAFVSSSFFLLYFLQTGVP